MEQPEDVARLIARLRARTRVTESYLYGSEGGELINPDGDAAAAWIERLSRQPSEGVLRDSFQSILTADPVCRGRVSSSAVERLLEAVFSAALEAQPGSATGGGAK